MREIRKKINRKVKRLSTKVQMWSAIIVISIIVIYIL